MNHSHSCLTYYIKGQDSPSIDFFLSYSVVMCTSYLNYCQQLSVTHARPLTTLIHILNLSESNVSMMNSTAAKRTSLKGNLEYPEKTSRFRVENQQTQPTYYAESGNRTRATLVGGDCSHHCAIPVVMFWCKCFEQVCMESYNK